MSVLRDMVQHRQDRQARRDASLPRIRAWKTAGYTVLLVVVVGIIAANCPSLWEYLPARLAVWLRRLAQLF